VAGRISEPWKFWVLTLLSPLYTRIKPEEIEESVRRAEIMAYIRIHQGVNFTILKKDLGYSEGQLAHHLNMLGRAKRIKSRNYGIWKLFYTKDFRIPEHGLFLNPNTSSLVKEILHVIEFNSGLNQKELSEVIGKERKSLAYHLNKLVKYRMIRIEKRGKEKFYYPMKSLDIPKLSDISSGSKR